MFEEHTARSLRGMARLTCAAAAHGYRPREADAPCNAVVQLIVGLVWFVETLGIILLVGLIIMKSTVVRAPA